MRDRLFLAVCVWLGCVFQSGMAAADDARALLRTENVILVTADGLRWEEVFGGTDPALMNKEHGGVAHLPALQRAYERETPSTSRQALLPFFWSTIAREGQLFGNEKLGSLARVTNGLNFSYPGYNEMLTGAPDLRINSNGKHQNPNVSVLEWLNSSPRWQGRVAVFGSWDLYPFILNQKRSGVFINSGWEPLAGDDLEQTPQLALVNELVAGTPRKWDDSRYDSFTFAAAREYFRQSAPRILYVAFDDTDEFAHEGHYDHYLDAANRVDRYVRTIWDDAQSRPQYRGKTTLIVTTDHGRGGAPKGWRNHGATTQGSDKIWLAVLGPDTPALGERRNVPEITQGQVAATLAAFLGADFRAALPRAAPPIEGVIAPPAPAAKEAKQSPEPLPAPCEAPPVAHLPIPDGWRTEDGPYPPPWAKQLPWKGALEIRFPPGWFDAKSDYFWSYPVLYWLEGDVLAKDADIEKALHDYDAGLYRGQFDPSKIKVTISASAKTEKLGHAASVREITIDGFDPFATKKPLRTYVQAYRWYCPQAERTAVLLLRTPHEPTADDAVWKRLRQFWEEFTCHAAG